MFKVTSYSHGIIVQVLHYLDVGLGECDSFFNLLFLVRVNLSHDPSMMMLTFPMVRCLAGSSILCTFVMALIGMVGILGCRTSPFGSKKTYPVDRDE